MANYEATKYDFDGANLTGIEGIPTATIVPWTASSLPSGFLECAGAAVSRSTYSALFAIVSTTYGAGDGSTTFNLPNLQDNIAVGKSGTKALASTGGAATVSATGNITVNVASHTLSTAELAAHTHGSGGGGANNQGCIYNPGAATAAVGGNTGSSGSNSGHVHGGSGSFSGTASSVLQPYLTLIYVIKT